MDLDAWRAAGPWLDQALDLAPAERDAWLAGLELDRPDVAATLRLLFASSEHPGFSGFLGDSPTLIGRRFGPYVLERELGAGGMASVWLGRRDDGRFEGSVAIKLPNVQRLTRAGSLRFAREGALLARLSHPNVARLLDAGVQDGQPYLVLEYVDGQPIDAWSDAHGLSVRERVRLFLDVLDAVAHAHVNLVLHRDLKPSNILVDSAGRVKLLDFGVAKLIEAADRPVAATELTREAGRAFTPAFAAPEQELGEPVTTASDVYSLGILLYLLLGGRHPTSAESGRTGRARPFDEPRPLSTLPGATAPDVAATRSTTPSKLSRELRGDLENIVAKALKIAPGERYATAAAFAADLRHYLNSEPVTARRASLGYRMSRFVGRHRVAVGAASITMLALLAGIAGTTWQAIEAQRQRHAALLQAKRADESRLFLRLMVSEIGDGSKPVTGLDILDRGAALLREQVRRDPRFVADEMIQLASMYDTLQQQDRARDLLVEAERRARELGSPDVLARALCEAADLDLVTDQRPQAERRLSEARTLLAQNDAPTTVSATCLSVEANALDAAGDSRGAIDQAQAAIDLLVAHGMRNHPLRSALLTRLSKYHDDLGERLQAYESNRQAALAMVEDGTSSTMNGLTARINYAADLNSFGEFRAAADVTADVVAKAALRGDVRVDLAANHGAILGSVGRFDEAQTVLDDTIERARAAGSEFWELRARFFRARLLVWQNRLAEADAALAEVERAYARDPEQNRIFLVSTAATRADWLARSGRASEAYAAIEEVLKRIGYPDDPTAQRFANTLAPLAAQIALAAGKTDRAAVLARDGVRQAEAAAREAEASGDVGRARMVLGKVLIAQGQLQAGRTMLESALPPLINGFGDGHWLVTEARNALDTAQSDARGAALDNS
jgi:serine/threonine-protein kinase